MNSAFVTSFTPVGISQTSDTNLALSYSSFANARVRLTFSTQQHIGAAKFAFRMNSTENDQAKIEAEKEAAREAARKALSQGEPMVKFKKGPAREYTAKETQFSYTPGVKGGILSDLWLWATISAVLVPFLLFAWGVSSGVINLDPRF